jgi:hypothetical protein
MNEKVPIYISALFIVLVLYLLFFLINSFKTALNKLPYTETQKRKFFMMVPIVVFIWLIFISIFAAGGFFADFSSAIPKIFIVIIPPVVVILLSVFSKSFKLLLFQIPPQQLINLQFFRVFLELVMWLLFIHQIVPIQVTFLGKNFDIVAGITAPIIAFVAYKGGRYYPKLALVWNLVGLGLLVNKLIISLLSSPVWFGYFTNSPSNTIIGYYPYIWIPGFVVPMAFFLHLASIRQILILEKWQGKKKEIV